MKKIPPGLWKIFWIHGGSVKEEIYQNVPVPWPIAQWKKKILENTTHTMGTLVIVQDDTDSRTYARPPLKTKGLWKYRFQQQS